MKIDNRKVVAIVGAGPAGLTAALDLLKKDGFKPVILEKSSMVGGLSRTENFKGNRIDIGGHRFFSKSDVIMNWWNDILPMLVRNRLSRIFYLGKFFSYPISLSGETIKNLGLRRIILIGFSYLKSILLPIKPEKTLEDFFINRFGRRLYETFFKDYTEKVWGVPCKEIPAEWGVQRVKGLSISKALAHFFKSFFKKGKGITQKSTETSLIDRFLYPKYGPGQMWEEVRDRVKQKGGEIIMNCNIDKIELDSNRQVSAVSGALKSGGRINIDCHHLISSMPVVELIKSLGDKAPLEVKKVAEGLVYRDFITVGVLLKSMSSKITASGMVPDNWIYIQEPHVKVGRIQIFNNWSPYMVKDKNTIWVGMEYFANVGDKLWGMKEEELKKLAYQELATLGFAEEAHILDSVVIKMEKAYPAYFGSYGRFPEIIQFVNTIPNMFLVGRNGMHKYNNQDHSMLTAMEAVAQIVEGKVDKEKIWKINTEQEYHEHKK